MSAEDFGLLATMAAPFALVSKLRDQGGDLRAGCSERLIEGGDFGGGIGSGFGEGEIFADQPQRVAHRLAGSGSDAVQGHRLAEWQGGRWHGGHSRLTLLRSRPFLAVRCWRTKESDDCIDGGGAILSLQLPHFVMAATFTLAVGLVLQAVLLSAYLALRDPGVLRAIAKAWKPSLFAGFMGAFASEFWFLAFAIATAANVRTLALVEVLFAQGVTHFIFNQPTTRREVSGIVLVVLGVVLLVWAY